MLDLLFICLGNPGERFRDTRHNVGFRAADLLAAEQGLVFKKPLFRPLLKISNVEHTLTLVKPLTYMNNSGVVLPGLLRRHKLGTENLVVVCDNLDLPAGMCRLKRGK
ncbi:MAG: aminoacyl-tRNA hydrolase, partial [Spirochaetales bacterium]|nr:aminoacyl-tRNA hydrolase [Spirochaetales bacterium]